MRMPRSTPAMMRLASEMRRAPTEAESHLWAFLRNRQVLGVRFRRQFAVGPFVADFCAPGLKLVVEVDGEQHMDQVEYDAQRTLFFNEQGYRVLRFWNHEVLRQTDYVLLEISRVVDELSVMGSREDEVEG